MKKILKTIIASGVIWGIALTANAYTPPQSCVATQFFNSLSSGGAFGCGAASGGGSSVGPIGTLQASDGAGGLISTGTPQLMVGNIIATSTASSTFTGGIDAARVCLAGTTTCLGSTISGSSSVGPVNTPQASNGSGGFLATGTPSFTAGYFIATTTTASILPYASSTAITVNGIGYFTTGIGIGTTSPRTVLDVVTSSGGVLSIQNSSATGYSSEDFYSNGGVRIAGIGVGGSGVGAPYQNNLYIGTNFAANNIVFLPNGTETGRFLSSNGFFGLGTTTPTSQLGVQGNELLSGNLSVASIVATGTISSGNLTVGNSTGGFTARVVGQNATNGASVVRLDRTATSWLVAAGYQGALSNFAIVGESSGVGQTDGSLLAGAKLVIDTSGNVGIATATPSQILSVQGNGLFSGNLSFANLTATGTSLLATAGGNAGIGTSSPLGTLSVSKASASAAPFFVVASTTGATNQSVFTIDNFGHLVISAGNTPAITCTPSGGSVVGDDVHGTITTGTLSTACTITFASPYTATPYFVGLTTNSGTITAGATAISATSFTVGLSAALTGKIYYLLAQ